MVRLRLAVVGFGRLGRACAQAVRAGADLELVGVVRRPESASALPAPFESTRVASHVRAIGHLDAALLCVPPDAATGAAREILQMRVPLVECAVLEGHGLDEHYSQTHAAAHRHRVPAIVGAGWNPGMLPLLQSAFDLLIPQGRTTFTSHPGTSLHHTEAAKNIDGVLGALATEYRSREGRMTRYVYAELAKGTDAARVQAALAADPLFAGDETLLFPVASIAALEQEGHGVVIERRGVAASGAHQNIVFEARFDLPSFAARVMVDAARRLPRLKPGVHRYSLWAS